MSDQSATDPEDPEIAVESADDDDEQEIAPEFIWTSDDALDFEEARRLTGKRGATVALFAGDTGAGKTTLMVEIWTSLLIDGMLGASSIASSNNSLAFELRSFDSRVESGTNTTKRTDLPTEGFLHLGVRHEHGRQELLFADFSGEHFRAIREGAEIADELPWMGRVDRLALLVDGALVGTPATAEIAFDRTRRILWKLRDCPMRSPFRRLALVITKADQIDSSAMTAFGARLEELLALTRDLDPDAPSLETSARPASGADPTGLDDLIDWICSADELADVREPYVDRADRAFGRFS